MIKRKTELRRTPATKKHIRYANLVKHIDEHPSDAQSQRHLANES